MLFLQLLAFYVFIHASDKPVKSVNGEMVTGELNLYSLFHHCVAICKAPCLFIHASGKPGNAEMATGVVIILCTCRPQQWCSTCMSLLTVWLLMSQHDVATTSAANAC